MTTESDSGDGSAASTDDSAAASGEPRSGSTDPPDPGTASNAPDSAAPAEPGMPDLGQDWSMDDLDEEWFRRAEEKLDTVEFDTELGVELARDAFRVARGDLSEAEFHEKHGEAVEAEFGIDERPTKEALRRKQTEDLDGDGPLPGVPDLGDSSRRNVIKAMGGLAGATGLSMAAATGERLTNGAGGDGFVGAGDADAAVADADGEDGDVQMGMVIDTDACIACLLCVEACKRENDTDRGTHWMHVFRYEEEEYGEVDEDYLPRPCQHCSEPSCTFVCPTQARYKREDDGIVLTNYDTCIGCKYCEVACPYGVNFLGKGDPVSEHEDEEVRELSDGFQGQEVDRDGVAVGGQSPKGVMGKCTFCVHRQENEATKGTTACEDDCPVDAIHFGDMNDPDSQPREYLREQREDDAALFRLLDELGNEPNVVYLGNEPSKDARPVDGPYTYEDLGMVKLADEQDQEGTLSWLAGGGGDGDE